MTDADRASEVQLALVDPAYKDEGAVELYEEAGAGKIVSAHAKLARSIERQAAKLEEHFSTPYTEGQARVMAVATETLVLLESQIERWHRLLYPNAKREPRR